MTVQRTIAEAGEPHRLLLSRDHYLLLQEAGALDEFAKTELIDGIIYTVNAQHSRQSRVHITLVRRLSDVLERLSPPLFLGLELSVDLPS